MKKLSIILGVFLGVLLSGCQGVQEAAVPTGKIQFFDSFSVDDIAMVIITDELNVEYPIKLSDVYKNDFIDAGTHNYFVIKDKEVIKNLYDAGRSIVIEKKFDYPGTGILSRQIFVSKDGKILTSPYIVIWKSTVVFWGHPEVVNDEICFREGSGSNVGKMGHNYPYCKLIYDLMLQYNPAVIEDCQDTFSVHGGFEDLLFFGKLGKQKE